MGFCAICEKEFEDSELKQVILKKGIMNVCRNCFNEDMLVFNKPDPEAFDGIYSRKSVYSRLSESAGVRKVEGDKRRISEFGKASGVVRDEHLKKIANKNYEEGAKKLPPNKDLVDNFHWIIMRARRFRKISQKKLAEEIQESESAIDMAERGIIPEGKDYFVKKLEQYLGITISKKTLESRKNPDHEDLMRRQLIDKFLEENDFDVLTKKSLTVSDLKNMSESDDEEFAESGDKVNKKKWWQFGRKSSEGKKDVEDFDEEISDKDKELIEGNPFFRPPKSTE